jgi:putative oxidoreductase
MKNKNLGLLILRLALAIVFIAHGYAKLTGLEGTGMFFGKLGIPMPMIMAYVVTAVEFLGGILMLLGILVEYVGVLMAITMLVAIITAKMQKGFLLPLEGKYELEFLLLLTSLSMVFLGAGEWSIMKIFKKNQPQV